MWLNEFVTYSGQNNTKFPFIVFGNKCDLDTDTIKEKDILDWCSVRSLNYFLYETFLKGSNQLFLKLNIYFLRNKNTL